MRPTVQRFVWGSLVKSVAFWVVMLFVLLSAMNLVTIWRITSARHMSDRTMLLLIAIILVAGVSAFFSMLWPLRRSARMETDENQRELIGAWADLALRMLYFGLGGMLVGLAVFEDILLHIKP
jgi:hypothetical protein